jgi:insertion element IS1 protein InsB
VNKRRLAQLNFSPVEVMLLRVLDPAAELDEMWSFVQSKQQPRWLWQAVDHVTGEVLAYVLSTREDKAFLELKALLRPFGIQHFYTDGWGTYERHLDQEQHTIGKRYTQKIERKHLNYRTRIKRLTRKTICFSKSELMHDTVIGLFINRFEFGLTL